VGEAGERPGPGNAAPADPEVAPPLNPRARRLLRLAPVVAVPLGVALAVLGAPLADVLLLPLVVGVLPVLAVAQAVALRDEAIRRLPAYASTVVSLFVLTALCVAAAWSRGAGFLGLRTLPWAAFALWTAGLTGAGLGVMGAFRLAAGRLGLRENPFLRHLLPRSAGEKAAFVGVSFSAGIGEEFVFRGYVLGALIPVVGTAGAVVLSTVSFAFAHAYQGVLGLLRTGVLGAVLAWSVLASGSLLPAMAAHTLLDLIAGIVLADRLMVPDPPSRV
jgi:membrane protease YdiL (CAAX protease family)